VTHRQDITLLTRFVKETDIKQDITHFSIPDLGIKSTEGMIPESIIKENPDLSRDGEFWGVIKLGYQPPYEKVPGLVLMHSFKPFRPYQVDLEYFCEARNQFTIEEWVDLLIRSMEYNPHYSDVDKGFSSFEKKLLFLSRILIFVEPNLNMIELAPKGTGKSYIFTNLTKHGWLVSGGVVTRAKMFYDLARKTPGIITNYDFVALDEIDTIKFSDDSEIQGAFKTYLENGKYTVGESMNIASAGLMLLGNIPLTDEKRPIYSRYFDSLPPVFRSSALLDRFHGFIEGWRLIRMNEELKLRGYTLNVEYFSEILHLLRSESAYETLVTELLEIPEGADTRDTKAVIRLCTAYSKLLFPHIRQVEDVDRDLFRDLCLKPAMDKRRIIKEQISLIDPEYRPEVPKISIKPE
jgi:ATP-dependent Lon protease